MQRFIDHEICVAVTPSDLHAFLKDCEDAGIMWANGESPLSFEDKVVFVGKKVTIAREHLFDFNMVYSKYGDNMGKEVINYSDLVPLTDEETANTNFLNLNSLYD